MVIGVEVGRASKARFEVISGLPLRRFVVTVAIQPLRGVIGLSDHAARVAVVGTKLGESSDDRVVSHRQLLPKYLRSDSRDDLTGALDLELGNPSVFKRGVE